MGIFKAYDIRGVVPDELDAALAYKIGHAFARLLKARRLLVGRDMRVHSPEIAEAVIEGMRDAGTSVVSIGLTETPMAYWAIGSSDVDGGLCVTASHNPGKYNGMKLCRQGARPVSAANGILDLERMCKEPVPPPMKVRGKLEEKDVLQAYARHVAGFSHMEREVSIAIDAANGMAGHTLPVLLPLLTKVRATTMLMEPDGTFPNHEANPIKEENLDPVRELVKRSGSNVGVGFDGDADRCCFVDERGRTVPADLMTGLLSRELLARAPGAAIVYDLRSSWAVKEAIREAGGVPIRERVGHSFIKATMREKDAIFGGELSGHFYFKENYTCDSGMIAMVSVLDLLGRRSAGGTTLSALASDMRRYHATGEINFQVEDKAAVLARLEARFRDGHQDQLDGLTVEYGELGDREWWWFNVRPSNTEPYLRLNLEASSAALRDARRAELVGLIGEPQH
jgi:phosphomannomutase